MGEKGKNINKFLFQLWNDTHQCYEGLSLGMKVSVNSLYFNVLSHFSKIELLRKSLKAIILSCTNTLAYFEITIPCVEVMSREPPSLFFGTS